MLYCSVFMYVSDSHQPSLSCMPVYFVCKNYIELSEVSKWGNSLQTNKGYKTHSNNTALASMHSYVVLKSRMRNESDPIFLQFSCLRHHYSCPSLQSHSGKHSSSHLLKILYLESCSIYPLGYINHDQCEKDRSTE